MVRVTFVTQGVFAGGTTSQVLHMPAVSMSHTCPTAKGSSVGTEQALGLQQGGSLGTAQEAASSGRKGCQCFQQTGLFPGLSTGPGSQSCALRDLSWEANV